MTARPTVSVIVVSRRRPRALALCLTALGQLLYRPFEIVVVGCPAGLAAVAAHPLAGHIRGVAAPGNNISAARNTGLGQSGGDVIAFIDDDAIAEPYWLDHLVHPLARGRADLAGGFVTGRNGFDLQWGARAVDGLARHRVLDVPGSDPFVPDLPPDMALRTEGTNMAATRAAFAALGGFDTGYAFYLDDTDLNMRARMAGMMTVSVPLARVWHRQLPSERRGAERQPRDLTTIGQSLARYLDRHADPERREEARAHHRAAERRRALEHMVRGTIGPGDVGALLAGFDRGFLAGAGGAADWAGESVAAFQAFNAGPATRQHMLLQRLGPGASAHRIVFSETGAWLRIGGRFGRRRWRDAPRFLPRAGEGSPEDVSMRPLSRDFSPFEIKS